MDEEEDGDSSNERSAAATEKSGSLPFDAQEKETHEICRLFLALLSKEIQFRFVSWDSRNS